MLYAVFQDSLKIVYAGFIIKISLVCSNYINPAGLLMTRIGVLFFYKFLRFEEEYWHFSSSKFVHDMNFDFLISNFYFISLSSVLELQVYNTSLVAQALKNMVAK